MRNASEETALAFSLFDEIADSKSEPMNTSFLYQELKNQFNKTKNPVEVDFRSLVSWLKPGDQHTHFIHPYPAKMLPHIAYFFIHASILHPHNKVVLDPFSGSGTVALEASLAGYQPYVADSNPLAHLITKVKTYPYNSESLRFQLHKVLVRAKNIKDAPSIDVINSSLWYKPEHKKNLEQLLLAIQEIDNEHERDFFRICFSVTARKISYADPTVSVPVRLRVKPDSKGFDNRKVEERLMWINTAIPAIQFAQVCENNITRVESANKINPNRMVALSVGDDARKLIDINNSINKPLPSESTDLVITSPPYGSAQKYIRASSLALNWLGLALPCDLASIEKKSIGREHITRDLRKAITTEVIPCSLEIFINDISKKNELRAQIAQQYFIEMHQSISEISRVTKKGGNVIVVIGNNQVCGELIHNDDFIVQAFNHFGMSLELRLVDNIKSRGLMTKRNSTASIISHESILVFLKRG